MSSSRSQPTRRTAIAALGSIPIVTNLTSAQPAQPTHFAQHEYEIPIRGKAGPGLDALDDAMIAIMERHGIPGAALAIAKDGRLAIAKGYGWANMRNGALTEPETRFGLASLSKSFTSVAILKLVDQGKLGLDDKVFDHIKHIRPQPKAKIDARLYDITIRQCLNHSGGWDRTKSGDPVNWEPQICRSFRTAPPLSAARFLSFMMGVPLDFAPGTEAHYSNVGFIILGELIAKVSGHPYLDFVNDTVLIHMGIKSARLQTRDGTYPKGMAHRHLAGTLTPLPSMRFPMIDATGGWVASAVDIARFLTNIDGSRGECVLSEKARGWMVEPPATPLKPREDGTYFGLGWDTVKTEGKARTYFKDGSTQGMRTFMKRSLKGVNWALMYNASMDVDAIDLQITSAAVKEVQKRVEGLEEYPDVDLFKEFR